MTCRVSAENLVLSSSGSLRQNIVLATEDTLRASSASLALPLLTAPVCQGQSGLGLSGDTLKPWGSLKPSLSRALEAEACNREGIDPSCSSAAGAGLGLDSSVGVQAMFAQAQAQAQAGVDPRKPGVCGGEGGPAERRQNPNTFDSFETQQSAHSRSVPPIGAKHSLQSGSLTQNHSKQDHQQQSLRGSLQRPPFHHQGIPPSAPSHQQGMGDSRSETAYGIFNSKGVPHERKGSPFSSHSDRGSPAEADEGKPDEKARSTTPSGYRSLGGGSQDSGQDNGDAGMQSVDRSSSQGTDNGEGSSQEQKTSVCDLRWAQKKRTRQGRASNPVHNATAGAAAGIFSSSTADTGGGREEKVDGEGSQAEGSDQGDAKRQKKVPGKPRNSSTGTGKLVSSRSGEGAESGGSGDASGGADASNLYPVMEATKDWNTSVSRQQKDAHGHRPWSKSPGVSDSPINGMHPGLKTKGKGSLGEASPLRLDANGEHTSKDRIPRAPLDPKEPRGLRPEGGEGAHWSKGSPSVGPAAPNWRSALPGGSRKAVRASGSPALPGASGEMERRSCSSGSSSSGSMSGGGSKEVKGKRHAGEKVAEELMAGAAVSTKHSTVVRLRGPRPVKEEVGEEAEETPASEGDARKEEAEEEKVHHRRRPHLEQVEQQRMPGRRPSQESTGTVVVSHMEALVEARSDTSAAHLATGDSAAASASGGAGESRDAQAVALKQHPSRKQEKQEEGHTGAELSRRSAGGEAQAAEPRQSAQQQQDVQQHGRGHHKAKGHQTRHQARDEEGAEHALRHHHAHHPHSQQHSHSHHHHSHHHHSHHHSEKARQHKQQHKDAGSGKDEQHGQEAGGQHQAVQHPDMRQFVGASELVELPKFLLNLSRGEKEDDFVRIKGSKLPQRPKKRAKAVEKGVQRLLPGGWLMNVTRERYEVREKRSNKKKPRGLKAMNGCESDSD